MIAVVVSMMMKVTASSGKILKCAGAGISYVVCQPYLLIKTSLIWLAFQTRLIKDTLKSVTLSVSTSDYRVQTPPFVHTGEMAQSAQGPTLAVLTLAARLSQTSVVDVISSVHSSAVRIAHAFLSRSTRRASAALVESSATDVSALPLSLFVTIIVTT